MMDNSVWKATPEKVWSVEPEDVLNRLNTNREKGLAPREVYKRQSQFGRNQLREHRQKSIWQILVDQLKNLIILLLAAAAFVSFLYNEILEAWAIVIIIVLNTAIGFFTELRAVRSMEALFKLGRVETRVRRDGEVSTMDAESLVPGDIVLFEGGDIITADIRVLTSSKLQADESALTGESIPVSKSEKKVEEDRVLSERTCMLYKGTLVTRGSCEGVVISTGQETELGHISSLVEEAREERTPLEDRLNRLGYRLILLTVVVAVFIIISGVISGKETVLMIQTGIALAVAAIPEGLPIVATIALAKGMRIMARKNALINRLSSVETLGATEIIFSDKTGTLTENRMSVTRLYLPDREIEVGAEPAEENGDREVVTRAFETGMLCNNAAISADTNKKSSGDPLEVALLRAGVLYGIDPEQLSKRYPRVREEAFDPEIKMMAVWNEMEKPDRYHISVKGAPDIVLEKCDSYLANGEKLPLSDEERENWRTINEKLAADGLRVLALACREVETMEGEPYTQLSLIGIVGLLDPPRCDVKEALEICREAGIRIIMVTGDQPKTAAYIAKEVGLVLNGQEHIIHGNELSTLRDGRIAKRDLSRILSANIFARVSPGQKLDLIELFQKDGRVVGMTGDGVNDAPALKKADIGIAMGQRGTQIAREASDMVLTDDDFSTIITAIRQGRIIFTNIRRFVYYLLSCNMSEILVVGMASLLGAPLPVFPLQILFLNLVTDVFPALALGAGEGGDGIMQQRPRKIDEPVLTRKQWIGIGGYGLLMTVVVLAALYTGISWLALPEQEAVTLSFLTLALAQLWHVFNMRDKNSHILYNSIVRNQWIWGALVLCVMLLLGALFIPAVAEVMRLTPPDGMGWMVIGGLSAIPLIVGQLHKEVAVRIGKMKSSTKIKGSPK